MAVAAPGRLAVADSAHVERIRRQAATHEIDQVRYCRDNREGGKHRHNCRYRR
jgi:hypothetical protein